jgi:hypothetical protein
LSQALGQWSERFNDALVAALLGRLGVKRRRRAAADQALAALLIRALQSRQAGIDRIFFDWRGGRDPGPERYPGQDFRMLAIALAKRQRPLTHPYWSDPTPCSMQIEEVEAIWAAIAERDDWQPLETKVAAIRRMGEAHLADAVPTA